MFRSILLSVFIILLIGCIGCTSQAGVNSPLSPTPTGSPMITPNPTESPENRNLIINGDFENELLNWNSNENCREDQSHPYSGRLSAKFISVMDNGGEYYANLYQDITFTEDNVLLSLTAFAKGYVDFTKNETKYYSPSINVYVMDNQDQVISFYKLKWEYYESNKAEQNYTFQSLLFVTPMNISKIRIEIECLNSTESFCNIDNVVLTKQ